MSTILIIGDPHIGKCGSLGKVGIGSNLNSRILDQINLLDWSLERAIHHGVTDIVLTGDVFDDPKPATSLITIFISWLHKCRANEINVHIIVGNHDVLRSGMAYNSPLDVVEECQIDGIYVYRSINTCIYDGFSITYAPFRDRKSFGASSNAEALSMLKNQILYEQSIAPVTYKKILIGHFAIDGSIPVGDEVDDLSNELMCPLNLFEGYDYVWMGHIHKPQIMNSNPHIAHIGSMDISDFGEVGQDKKIVIFDLNIDNHFIYETLPTRPLNKICIDVPEDEENPTEYVIDNIKSKNLDKSIVKLEINLANKSKNLNKLELEKQLKLQGTFNISSIVESKKSVSVKKEDNKLSNKMDVVSAIKQYASMNIEESLQSEFIQLASGIYKQYQEES